ncbi:MAG TPA: trigger factor [Candidatus Onthenecus intestinigallinarum]|uniref:Trigger factor n=1 Tax=Candidatus Onthenecus intestinigallinarum TaxID=2840875 RepID=A0A9D0ZAS6_9FIRM|nr:trigger factor [Candidatus Onthenecus intestinigallinarum]
MTISVEKLSSNKVKISFDIEAEKFEEAMQKSYLKNRGRVNVPGFRKGKAPRKLIENMYGEGVFYDDAFEALFPEAYDKAVEENALEPVDRPNVDIQQIGSGKNLQFTAEVFVRPDVTLGEYKGLKVERHEHPVTDEQVDAQVEQARQRAAREISVEDRAVQDDDIVNLDYAGTVDGVAFEGGAAKGQRLTIGSGQFIPGFEEQMVGMQIGEEKDLSVKFPEEYHAKELAGKDAVFHVKVNSITVRELPALDDDFAKDVSEFDTLDAYKQDIRAKLEAESKEHCDAEFENALVDAAVANATLDVPGAMIERQIDGMLRDFQMRLAYQGMRLEDFMKYTGQGIEELRTQYREQADKRVRAELVLQAIKKAEGIEATDEEVEAEIAKFAEEGKKTVEEFKASLKPEDIDYLKDSIGIRKTVDMLKAAAAE